MDPQFQELSDQISKNVSAIVTRDVTAAVTRDVTAAVTRDVTATVSRDVTAVVTRDVTAAVSANLTEVLKAAEQRLSSQATILAEDVKGQAKLAAEGYAATLDGINRRLDGIEKAVNTKLLDHDKVLANHASRLVALEPK
jgi:uncharacterized phage infection (PIP) family protein YhgE